MPRLLRLCLSLGLDGDDGDVLALVGDQHLVAGHQVLAVSVEHDRDAEQETALIGEIGSRGGPSL